ncbi:MAG: hypothetical protein JW837_16155 [Sedimentisphaerales bacterium]|nr:hypothetical protein [Sedimentisphaerales bacterium]
MKIGYLKEKKELISVAMLCLSAILTVSILFKIAGFFTAPAKAKNIIDAAVKQNTEDANNIDKHFAKYRKLADELKEKNLFAPPAPKQHPVSEISGILGDEVIIGDRLYKVGDRVADAKILSIEPTQVTIEWDGKETTFSPIDAGGSSPPDRPGGPRPTAGRGGHPTAPGGGSAQMVMIQSQAGPPSAPPMAGPGPGIKPMNMSDEERAKLKEKLKNMPPEERQKYIAEMQERMAGRR